MVRVRARERSVDADSDASKEAKRIVTEKLQVIERSRNVGWRTPAVLLLLGCSRLSISPRFNSGGIHAGWWKDRPEQFVTRLGRHNHVTDPGSRGKYRDHLR